MRAKQSDSAPCVTWGAQPKNERKLDKTLRFYSVIYQKSGCED
jgi:hypothetical protein